MGVGDPERHSLPYIGIPRSWREASVSPSDTGLRVRRESLWRVAWPASPPAHPWRVQGGQRAGQVNVDVVRHLRPDQGALDLAGGGVHGDSDF